MKSRAGWFGIKTMLLWLFVLGRVMAACGSDDASSFVDGDASAATVDAGDSSTPAPIPRSDSGNGGADASVADAAPDVASPDAAREAGVVASVSFNPPAGPHSSAFTLVLATTTPEAIIHYTLDASEPSDASTVYTGPITIDATTTVKALAIRTGYTGSAVTSATYTFGSVPSVAPIAFSPDAGTYVGFVDVALSTTTINAVIRYSLDGVDPTAASTAYNGAAIPITKTTTIKAFGTLAGSSDSAVTSATFTIAAPTVEPVAFSPAGGPYANAQSVTLATATVGASIWYTTDGSTPTTASLMYTSPIPVGQTRTLKAFATKAGFTAGAVTSATYTITLASTVEPVEFLPAGGSYPNPIAVALSSPTAAAKIYYTVDGSTPTSASSVYTAGSPISITKTTTVKAFAMKSGASDSGITSATYTIGQ